jgi:ABC-type multidrug transport system ATPase subunit
MRILLGTLRPDAGVANVEGPVGYLPESFAAYEALSVRSYLGFIARMKNVRARSRVDDAMDLAGVADLGSRPVERLSKGQRQRVGMAQALLGSPRAFITFSPPSSTPPSASSDGARSSDADKRFSSRSSPSPGCC